MRAVQIEEKGGPEVLRLVEVERPEPGEGEVLVEVAAAGVNYADLQQREGAYPLPGGLPFVPGFEAAGTVAAVGPGADGPAEGARVVVGLGGGGYAEYVVAPAGAAVPVPENVGFPEATALYVQGLTAHGLLRRATGLREGESVLVHAAAGGVGSLAVQLAKLMGAGTVVGTASAPEKLELARSLGADAAVDYSRGGWTEEVMEATGGRGADVVLEMVGGEIGEKSLDVLAPSGRMAVFGAASGEPLNLNAQRLIGNSQSVVGYTLFSDPGTAAAGEEIMRHAAEGRLRVIVGETFLLENAAEAHRAMAARKTTGKVVLTTQNGGVGGGDTGGRATRTRR